MNRHILISIGGVCAILMLWVALGENSPEATSVSSPSRPVEKGAHAQEILLSQRPKIEKKSSELSDSCRDYWNRFREVDLRDVVEFPPERLHFPTPQNCERSGIPALVLKAHGEFVETCGTYDATPRENQSPKEWRRQYSSCHLKALLYRAAMSDWATGETQLSEIRDPKILRDKMAVALTDRDLEKMEAVASRYLEINPDSTDAKEVQLVARYGKNLNETNPNWDEVLRLSENLNRDDARERTTYVRTQLLVEFLKNEDPDSLRKMALEFGERYPEQTIVPQALALAAYRNGDAEAAIAHYQEYFRRTGDPEAAQVIQKIKDRARSPFRMALETSVVLHESP